MIDHVHACALILGLLVLPILNAIVTMIARRMHQEECSYTNTTSTSDDDRTWDILNRMAEYEDIPEEEPTVIEVPNLAEDNERYDIKGGE